MKDDLLSKIAVTDLIEGPLWSAIEIDIQFNPPGRRTAGVGLHEKGRTVDCCIPFKHKSDGIVLAAGDRYGVFCRSV